MISYVEETLNRKEKNNADQSTKRFTCKENIRR